MVLTECEWQPLQSSHENSAFSSYDKIWTIYLNEEVILCVRHSEVQDHDINHYLQAT